LRILATVKGINVGWSAALVLAIGLSACAAASNGPPDGGRSQDGGTRLDASRPDAGPIPVRCGDLICAQGAESCEDCPLDCGECPTCDFAPTCTGALAAPTSTEPLAECGNVTGSEERTNYACGTDVGLTPSETSCADPQLRIRIRQIRIERGFFDIERQLFCVITAEDGAHSELLLTPPREVAGNRRETTINLPLSQSVLWGQADLYRSIANITITYACYLSSSTEGAQRVLDQIAGRAAEVAEHADGYGWVFGTVSVLGTIIGSSLSAVADDQILDVQQTISSDALLDLTNGRTWEIRQRRGNLSLSGASDLRLTVETWGCAGVRNTFD
jgi:hypothetical protein